MQPPWRLPGIEGGGTPPHQREWSGQGAALSWPREYAGESHTNAQGLYKWALPCFLRRLLCSKILPSIEALSHFPAQLPRKFQSRNPDAPQTATGRRRAALTALGGPDAPQTATGRRRAALTALGVQMPPDRHRTPESGPDGPRGSRCPQTATGRRRAALTALGVQMPPDRHRTPESGPNGPRGSRCPQTATGRRRAALTALGGPDAPQTATGRRRAALTALGGPDAPQTATGRRRAALTALGGPDAPQTATGRPILSKIPTSRPGPGLGGVERPLKPPFFYLTHLGRAPARAYARA